MERGKREGNEKGAERGKGRGREITPWLLGNTHLPVGPGAEPWPKNEFHAF